MNAPYISLMIASACALLQFALTALVIARRVRSGVRFLHGDDENLLRAIRAHGNLTETTPIVLILLLMHELAGLAPTWLWTAGGVFLIGRVIHAVSFTTDRAPWGRQVGMLATLFVLFALAVFGATRALQSIN